MNRPSRSDDTTDHPTWNQNPPYLASDLTTREDLNGKANAREYRGGCGDGAETKSGLAIIGRLPLTDHNPYRVKGHGGSHRSGQRSVTGSCPASKEALTSAGDYVHFPAVSQSPFGRRSKAVLGWVAWGFSVIAMSILLNKVNMFAPPKVSPLAHAPAVSSPSHSSVTKRSACGSGEPISEDEYNTPLHVGGLIIILAISFASCACAMVMKKMPRVRMHPTFFFVIRHFGTGVLIATAFVHLLPTAFISLGDPCLPPFWNEDYPAMPGAIALAGIFLVALIEMVFSPHRHIQPYGPNTRSTQGDCCEATASPVQVESTCPIQMSGEERGPMGDKGPLRGRSMSISRQLSRVGQSNANTFVRQSPTPKHEVDVEQRSTSPDSLPKLTPEQQHKKDILQCMLLEMGILFHSIFIGMALSITIGREFVVLLIAIAFHQAFEGLALGARIAAIDWPPKAWQPWLMCLAYGCTTPLGQAIGISVHSLYDPEGEFGLILVGTMNAISSGLLVFASLVELLSEDLLSDASWREVRGRKRVAACLIVLAGAFGMSLVGAWA